MHTVFALLCFVVVIHWLIFPYPPSLLHWHCGNLTIAPVPAKQPCWIWINTSCEFIMNDCITTTKQSTTKPCAYFLGYTVSHGDSKKCWWTKCHSVHQYPAQITWTLGWISIRHRSDTFASDRLLIDVDPRVFAICEVSSMLITWSCYIKHGPTWH